MNFMGVHQSTGSVAAAAQATLDDAYVLILSSVALGLILMLANVLFVRRIPKAAIPLDNETSNEPAAILLNSSNILFLCVGVTGVMLLVASDLARAFAVAAAIALVRFRIKMSEGSGSSLFFALIVGMACGVDHVRIAVQMAAIFITLQGVLLILVRRSALRTELQAADAPAKSSQLAPTRA